MDAGMMGFGGFFLALGFALILGLPSVASLLTVSSGFPSGVSWAPMAADGVIFGIILAPIGGALFAYGLGRNPPDKF